MIRSALLVCVLFHSVAFAGSNDRIMVLGDSWSAIMTVGGFFQGVLEDNGLGNMGVAFETTAIGGTTAELWNTQLGLDTISAALADSPNVEVVQITLSGNDFLEGFDGGWTTQLSAAEETALFDRIADDLEAVVQHIQGQKSDVQILLSFYDYINVVDLNCDSLLQGLGNPTQVMLSQAMLRMEAVLVNRLTQLGNVTHVANGGLMQVTFGYQPAGIEPGDLHLPGDVNLPSPQVAMSDCIHLSAAGYRALSQHLVDQFYRDFFSGDQQPGEITAWLPHITSATGGFTTEVLAYNDQDTMTSVTLEAYDLSGVVLGAQEIQLAGGSTTLSLAELFNGEVSHLAVRNETPVHFSAAYQYATGGAIAHSSAAQQSATRWQFYTAAPTGGFDGMAIVNAGTSATTLRLQWRDASGIPQQINLAESLPVNVKQLVVLSEIEELPANGSLILEADQPVVVMALRGNNSGDVYLYQNPATPLQ